MTTPVLGLPELVDGQASQGAVHNQALRELMAKTVRVKSRTTTAQPGSPTDGDTYILAATHTGAAWGALTANQIVHWIGGVWVPYTPAEGWRVWVNDEDVLLKHDGSAWDIIDGLIRAPAIAQSSATLSVTAAHRGRVIVCDTTSNSITLNLLAAATAGNGFVFEIVKKAAANTLTVDPNSTELINGGSTIVLTDQWDSRIIVCDGAAWYTIGGGGGGGASLPITDAAPHFKRATDGTSTGQFNLDDVAPATNVEVLWPTTNGKMALVSDISGGGNGDAAFGENSGGHSGLNYAYFGGGVRSGDTLITGSGSTILLTDNATNYVELYVSGGAIVVATNTTGFTAGRFAMAEVVTLAGAITAVTDRRYWIVVPSARADVCLGRLTLETGVAIPATDQTAKTTIYFTPYNGNVIALYNGLAWPVVAFAETSLALGTLTADKNYDVFGYLSGGALALELSAAWTTDTARADALALQDGVLVKSGTPTRRYLGTFRTVTTTTTEDSAVKRLVWNMYNRTQRPLLRQESTDSWNWSTASFHQANASAANQIGVVTGQLESLLSLAVYAVTTNSTTTVRSVSSGIGVNSTSASSAQVMQNGSCTSTVTANSFAGLNHVAPLGYTFYVWLEYGAGSETQSWRGDAGVAYIQTGMTGYVMA